MENEIHLTEDELKGFAEIHNEFNNAVFMLGQLELAQEEAIKKRAELLTSINNMHTKETLLFNNITEKYGDGYLKLDEGIFIPSKK